MSCPGFSVVLDLHHIFRVFFGFSQIFPDFLRFSQIFAHVYFMTSAEARASATSMAVARQTTGEAVARAKERAPWLTELPGLKFYGSWYISICAYMYIYIYICMCIYIYVCNVM